MTSLATAPDKRWASTSDIFAWLKLSFLIALIMLVGVIISAYLATPDESSGYFSLLLSPTHEYWEEIKYLISRNCLVLGIHFGACIIGAIIARRSFHIEASQFNPNLPEWVSKAALWYAWIVTLGSILIQVSKIGLIVADISQASGINIIWTVLLTTPHSLIELTAIFLPLALFMIQATRGELYVLGRWSLQAAAVSIPMIILAALIEVFITPHIFSLFN